MRGIPGALLRAALDAHGQVGSKGIRFLLVDPNDKARSIPHPLKER